MVIILEVRIIIIFCMANILKVFYQYIIQLMFVCFFFRRYNEKVPI